MRLPPDMSLPEGFVPDPPPDVPATPKDAATVVLLRDGASGLEVFLQRRVTAMAFAAGMTVFPGGGVDARDAEATVPWAGPPPEWWARRFSCTTATARALVCAAVRETFEESGVLLAGADADTVVGDTAGFAEARSSLVSRELSLAEFLADEELVLRADLLRPWANWVTPEREPRRYDTRFFLAAIPEGQRADAVTSEAADAYWRAPAAALDDAERGRSALMPPTWATLAEVAEYASAPEALASRSNRMRERLTKVVPRMEFRDGRWHVVLRGAAEEGFSGVDLSGEGSSGLAEPSGWAGPSGTAGAEGGADEGAGPADAR
ncbi:NUDIX domain-containing protein [Salinifilum aidingensis]